MVAVPSFEQTLSAARSGDPRAYRWIWDTYAGGITGFLQARGTLEVEEIVNDVFLALFTGLEGFTGDEGMFRSWIYRIALNKRVDSFRRAARRVSTAPGSVDGVGGDVEEEAVTSLVDDDLRPVLAELTPAQRDVIVLRFVADLSTDQVAAVLGLDRGAVKALQHRAVARLRRKIATDPHPSTVIPAI